MHASLQVCILSLSNLVVSRQSGAYRSIWTLEKRHDSHEEDDVDETLLYYAQRGSQYNNGRIGSPFCFMVDNALWSEKQMLPLSIALVEARSAFFASSWQPRASLPRSLRSVRVPLSLFVARP